MIRLALQWVNRVIGLENRSLTLPHGKYQVRYFARLMTVKSSYVTTMVTKDDVRLMFAYFHLKSRRKYCPHEIAYRPALRARFLRLAREMLGATADADKEIIQRLLTLRRLH